MPRARTNPSFLNGVPELLILRLLSSEAMHGYQVVQAIKNHSGGKLDFGEGCIYPILHRLEKQGDLASRREQVGGRSRVVYRTTARGKRRFTETAGAWMQIVEAVHQVLQGGEHGSEAVA